MEAMRPAEWQDELDAQLDAHPTALIAFQLEEEDPEFDKLVITNIEFVDDQIVVTLEKE